MIDPEVLKRLEQHASLIRQLQGFGFTFNVGSGSVTFTASANSAQVTIAHGLPSVPVAVFGMAAQPVNGRVHIQESAAADATNIYLSGYQSAGSAVSISQQFYWLAFA